MFSSAGRFSNVDCPQQHNCTLIDCFFNHELQTQTATSTGAELNVYDPLSAGSVDPPPLKRRRLDSPEVDSKKRKENGYDELQKSTVQSASLPSGLPARKRSPVPQQKSKAITTEKTPQPTSLLKTSKPSSLHKPVSPPTPQQPKPSQTVKTEKLMPRQIARAPVQLNSRMTCLKLIHDTYKDQNERVRKAANPSKDTILSEQELITLGLDEEQEVASSASSSEIYRNVIAQKVLRAKKMIQSDWLQLVSERFRRSLAQVPTQEITISTGLAAAEEIEILRGLKTAVAGLESHGYVTCAPTVADIEKAKNGVAVAAGFETCDRCSRRFQVFPGRDSDGRLTSHGACYYHWARLQRVQTAKASRMTGQAEGSYPCCGQSPGSEGCTTGETHVFKVSEPKRLASLLQFEKTPMPTDGKKRVPVAFDCEMAYTTYGMELIRVTAVSWPENKELLDVLVRPYGEILDMNTRFSGVSHGQFAGALPYDAASAPEDENQSFSLRKVKSPAAARQLLFDLVTPDTPLIGHAIENDLNACRIIHPFIVDTVLLYPHPKGLPIRYGLKMLAMKYLRRTIQAAGDQGHDSKEDSIATGDLVRAKVAEKWKNMQSQGWKFQDGRLVFPNK